MKGYKKKFDSLSKKDQTKVLVYQSAIKAARKERHRIIDREGHRKARAKQSMSCFEDSMARMMQDMKDNPNEPENRVITATVKDLYNQGTMSDDDMHAIFSAMHFSGLDSDDIWDGMPLADVMDYADKNSEFYQHIIATYITHGVGPFQKVNKTRYAPTLTAEEERDKYKYEQQIKNYQAMIEAIFNK